jgi:hypothetical protein
MTIFMLLDDRVQDILDFRSHFKFYLINIKWRTRLQEKGILVKEKKQ